MGAELGKNVVAMTSMRARPSLLSLGLLIIIFVALVVIFVLVILAGVLLLLTLSITLLFLICAFLIILGLLLAILLGLSGVTILVLLVLLFAVVIVGVRVARGGCFAGTFGLAVCWRRLDVVDLDLVILIVGSVLVQVLLLLLLLLGARLRDRAGCNYGRSRHFVLLPGVAISEGRIELLSRVRRLVDHLELLSSFLAFALLLLVGY